MIPWRELDTTMKKPTAAGERLLPASHLSAAGDSSWPLGDLRLKGLNPGLRTPMCPYVALRFPTYPEKFTR
jgi:hypothetical protein